jgi:purine-binding chemotaxis protein CheW
VRHVIFRVEQQRYGLPLLAVKEVVVPPPSFTRVPRAPPAVSGVMNLRGRVVTVVELRQLLGLPDGPTPPGRVVLLDRGRRDLGLLVTEVDGIDEVGRMDPAPGPAVPAVRGLVQLRGLAVTVLDAEGLDSAMLAMFGAQK